MRGRVCIVIMIGLMLSLEEVLFQFLTHDAVLEVVKKGPKVRVGQLVGTMGTTFGMTVRG